MFLAFIVVFSGLDCFVAPVFLAVGVVEISLVWVVVEETDTEVFDAIASAACTFFVP